VKIWDTWKTLKYLNINDSFHLKYLEISKYKRESKGRWPIKMCRFIFVNCCLIWLSKHWKCKKIYAIPYIFSTTLLLYKLDTLLLKQKNLPVLDITGFFIRIRTQVTALVLRTSAFTWVLMRKKKPVIYPIRAASFVSIVLYPMLIKLFFNSLFSIHRPRNLLIVFLHVFYQCESWLSM
jgi:hypothetical protein